MKQLKIAISGTMGSGKTTAARLLSKRLKIPLLEENFGENAFLPRFYTDMKRWSFHSQTFFLMEKISQMLELNVMLNSFQHLKNKKPEIPGQAREDRIKGVIIDTPIYQDVFSYAKALHVMGNMDDAEWRLYQKIYRSFLPSLPVPTHIVYLKTSLPKVIERISGRQRDFEKQIPEGYLELLEMLNETWMKKEANESTVITVPTDDLNIVRSEKDKKTFVKLILKNLKI